MQQNFPSSSTVCFAVFDDLKPDGKLQKKCCKLFKFKAEAKPMFCKPRTVPFAHEEDLAQAYDAGIKHGVWRKTQFNECGTVVPIRKPLL